MIELTVIGGYLGAGKTTLVNEILDRRDGERVAVIVNDFGTVNIDAEIIGSADGRTWEIANGCICCDLSDGMAVAIENIRNAEPPVSRVYIEVSGVGQPEVVARWGSHPGFVRGGSIVCADPTSIRRDVNRKWVGETVASQLRGADRLLLTKTDLVGPEQIDEVRQWLNSQPGIDAQLVERDQVLSGEPSHKLAESAPAPTRADHRSSADLDTRSAHGDEVRVGTEAHHSWTITTSSSVSSERLRELVLALPECFLRVKGIVRDRQRPGHHFLVQFDGSRFETEEIVRNDNEEDADNAGHLVLIAARGQPDAPMTVSALARALGGAVDTETDRSVRCMTD